LPPLCQSPQLRRADPAAGQRAVDRKPLMNPATALLFLTPLAAVLLAIQPGSQEDREGPPEKAVGRPAPRHEPDREEPTPAKGKPLPIAAPKLDQRDAGSAAADLQILRARFKDRPVRVEYLKGEQATRLVDGRVADIVELFGRRFLELKSD